jgi:tetratricopeptide (TPR) repeat protein
MKKVIGSFCLIISIMFVSAQPHRVVSAFNYLREGRLDKALENIDFAFEHPRTQSDVKTWLYKGNILLALALSEDDTYKHIHPNPLQGAYDAYQKSIEIDNEYIQPTANPPSAKLGLFIIGEQYYNRGVEKFNNSQFKEAIPDFEKTKTINNIFGIKDSLATFNAAICAIQIEDDEKAVLFLRELITMNYKNPVIYSYLASLYIRSKEYDRAMQIIRTGKNRFPDDLNILIAETNIFLATDEIEKAQNTLQTAVEKDPNNPILYFTIGSNYDQLAKKEGISDEERNLDFQKAEESYLKAIEINPEYFDAIYNLGALFYNEGVRIFEDADKITDFKLYEKEKVKYEAMWTKALPYLEKAHKLNPYDFSTLVSLRTLYARLSKEEDFNRINERLKELE